MVEISGDTIVTGIIGYPLTYTLSPFMHNAALEELGLDYRYLPFVVEPAHLIEAINGIKALNISGINVTMPHKENVIPLLDELSEEALQMGAVNTIKNTGGSLTGHNTDGVGFLRSLQDEHYDVSGKHVVIIGAGGAAKAVAMAVAGAGAASLTIVAREKSKADALKDKISAYYHNLSIKTLSLSDDLADIMLVGELIVNATPIGMKESGCLLPVPLDLISGKHFIFDLIYTPLETALIKEAKQKKAKAINGLGMLLYQAAAAFEIWTGISAPVETMREALLGALISGDRSGYAKQKNRRIST
ncbi:MAG: shikimate dehydrogenase [Rubrobacteridae bacterium]|nr:shikimate dehydrogenase [Rubrobacteridae bacterium]